MTEPYIATSLNASITYVAPPYIPVPIELVGFEVENMFEMDAAQNYVSEIGIDKHRNIYQIPQQASFKIHLFSASPSIDLLDFVATSQTTTDVTAFGTLVVTIFSQLRVVTYQNVILMTAFTGFGLSKSVEARVYDFTSDLPIVSTLGVR